MLIFVAWTLVYELAFYIIYWLALRVAGKHAAAASLLVLLFFASVSLPLGAGPWPLLAEFALGIAAYLAAERVGVVRRLPGLPGLGGAALGLALLLTPVSITGYNPDDYQSASRVLFWGLPAAAVVFGLVVAERDGLALQNRLASLLGAASYAIYLIHPIAVGQLIQIPPQTAPMSLVYCAVASLTTIGVATAYYRFVEAPMLSRLRHQIDGRRATA